MFTRPPSSSESNPAPYLPGYIAYPSGSPPSIISEEARLFRERVRLHRERLQRERDELERAKAARDAADSAWEKEEEVRRARREKLKEETLKAEIEWERMGGRMKVMDPELRRELDEEANLTEEERALKRSWEAYDNMWEHLAAAIKPVKTFTFRKVSFTFADIPWPILRQPVEEDPQLLQEIELKDITVSAVTKFLLHPLREPKRSRKEKLREAMLHYHPDKFEGRILPRVIEQDRVRVQEAVGAVMKCLNELMKSES